MGLFQREVTEMTDIGLNNMGAVLSGTSEAAKSIGVDHLVGTLEPTKEADVIVVEGNPLADIGALSNISAVFKGGVQAV